MSLSDIDHDWGQDLGVSATGDLELVSGTLRGQQRIVRRLLTNAGDYSFEPDYGAGVLQAIGSTEDQGRLVSTIRSQTLLEDSVAATPAPTVTVNSVPNDTSALAVTVAYTDQPSNAPTVLSFSVSQ